MNPDDLLADVIAPTLDALGLRTPQSEQLVLGTAIAESGLDRLHQVGGGPGSGLWQVEPYTARDILGRYLGRSDKRDLRRKVMSAVYPLGSMSWRADWTDEALSHALTVNLALGAAVCRLIYRWVPEPIPDTLEGQAQYHLTHYNKGGAATPDHYVAAWRAFFPERT